LQSVAVLLLYMAVKLHPACGKLLFSLADLAVGQAIELILKSQGIAPRHTLKCAALWLLNPVAANISTRGSCDALTAALVLLAAKGASGTQR
jgi:GPI mannosyltransferase 1 subunit M